MSSSVDSKAVFEARASSCGLSAIVFSAFQAADLDTMSKFAFGCAFQPHSPDEAPLIDMFRRVLTREPTLSEMATLRRLWYESHACMVQDMRGRIERTDLDGPKKIAPAERASRLVSQQARLSGLVIKDDLEPSFGLLDRVCQQYDQDQLTYIGPDECGSRAQEILGVKKDTSLKLERDPNGNVRAKEQLFSESTDVASDYKLRQAFTRRSLAYDQANLIDFAAQEAWASHLFKLLHKDVPHGYHRVTITQILKADRELFVLMADECRASIIPRLGNVRPLDVAIKTLMHHPDVAYLTLPLAGSAGKAKDRTSKGEEGPYPNPKAKSKGKGKGRDKGKGKGTKSEVPTGCVSRLADGRNVCYGFNSARGCSNASIVAGSRCRFGFHICGRLGCHGNHSMLSCPTGAV